MDSTGYIQDIYTHLHIHASTYINIIAINKKKEDMNFKKSRERYMGGFEGRKGKKEKSYLNYIVKNKQKRVNSRIWN